MQIPIIKCPTCDAEFRQQRDVLSGETVHMRPKGCRHDMDLATQTCCYCGAVSPIQELHSCDAMNDEPDSDR